MAAIHPLTSVPAETSVDDAPEAVAAAQPTHDIVVIGTSSGGVRALQKLAAALPAGCPAAIFVVMHISPEASSELSGILSRAGPLPALQAEDGMAIEPGRILTAPPDQHLLLDRGRVRVVHGPRENRHRPALDPTFRSAAWAYGPRVVGIVLTGNLDDGTAGLWAIKSCGGTTVVQEPAEAEYPEMPSNALMHNRIDHRLPLEEIGRLIARLAREPADMSAAGAAPDDIGKEVAFAGMGGDIQAAASLGTPSAFTCPSCRGALWELEHGGHLRYRCHTGHAFTHASLQVEQTLAVEEGLYMALRAVEEKAASLRRLAERWPDRVAGISDDYRSRARALEDSAEVLRTMLVSGSPK
jgi:two-component system, chemotaxis family, protein-glutamate methylesterase/glutaminase